MWTDPVVTGRLPETLYRAHTVRPCETAGIREAGPGVIPVPSDQTETLHPTKPPRGAGPSSPRRFFLPGKFSD